MFSVSSRADPIQISQAIIFKKQIYIFKIKKYNLINLLI